MSYLKHEIDNFLSKEELAEVWSAINSESRWKWHKFAGGAMFWYYEVFLSDSFYFEENKGTSGEWTHAPKWVEGIHPVWNKIYEKVKELAGPNFIMWRYIINGQTWGQEGEAHTDFQGYEKASTETFILYLNEEWDTEWGGDTIFYHPNSMDERGRIPVKPGKLIGYDSRIKHRGSAPTEENILRVTLAIQGKYE